jgi:hypothetical protein
MTDVAVQGEAEFAVLQGAWSIAYVSPDGVVIPACDATTAATNVDGRCGRLTWSERDASTGIARKSSDLDDDGTGEVVVENASCGDEGQGCTRKLSVFTLRGIGILPYAPAASFPIDDVEDVDGDGRLDFVVHGPYEASANDCVGNSRQILGPRLLVHSLPKGKTSVMDDVAKHYARASCREDVGTVVVKTAGRNEIDERATGHAIACARLRGESADDIAKKLAIACASFTFIDPCGSPDPASSTPEPRCSPWLEEWVNAPPPLSIE